MVTSIPVDTIDPNNNGRLVHVQGLVSTKETLHDPVFGASAQALRLRRVVEMFQWREREERQTRPASAHRPRQTTYRYEQTWSASVIDSSRFMNSSGHENPTSMPFQSAEWSALKFQIGAFRLGHTLCNQLRHFEPLGLRVTEPSTIVREAGFRPLISSFYRGNNPHFPQVGDVRVVFESVEPTGISIIAGQEGNTLAAFQTRTDGKLDLLRPEKLSPAEMFREAHFSNWLVMWACRIAGYLLMILAVRMLLRPLKLMAEVLPGPFGMLAFASRFLGFVLASGLALVVASVSWVAYRPRIGLPLLAGGLLLGLLVIWLIGRRNPTEAAS